MAATAVRFAVKGIICGTACYVFAEEVLTSQDDSVRNVNVIARTTRANLPAATLPEVREGEYVVSRTEQTFIGVPYFIWVGKGENTEGRTSQMLYPE